LRSRLKRPLVVTALAAVALAAGCGGGDDSSDSTTTTSTTTVPRPVTTGPRQTVAPAAYVARAKAATSALTAYGNELATVQTAADLPRAVPVLRQQIARMTQAVQRLARSRLTDPKLERQRAAIVTAGADLVPVMGAFVDAAERSDADAVRTLAQQLQVATTTFVAAASAE
jgi:hypothetical protein